MKDTDKLQPGTLRPLQLSSMAARLTKVRITHNREGIYSNRKTYLFVG